MKHISLAALAAALLLLAGGATAAPHEDKIRSILPEIQSAVLQQDVIDALRVYNERHQGLTQADIDRMEAAWQSELGSEDRPLISSIVENQLAARMRAVVKDTGVEDIVITGASGLSIAQSTPGTGIWQGENPTFAETTRSAPEAVFVDEIAFNEPTQSFQSRVSYTVADPDTGRPIGAITIGFNADSL